MAGVTQRLAWRGHLKWLPLLTSGAWIGMARRTGGWPGTSLSMQSLYTATLGFLMARGLEIRSRFTWQPEVGASWLLLI